MRRAISKLFDFRHFISLKDILLSLLFGVAVFAFLAWEVSNSVHAVSNFFIYLGLACVILFIAVWPMFSFYYRAKKKKSKWAIFFKEGIGWIATFFALPALFLVSGSLFFAFVGMSYILKLVDWGSIFLASVVAMHAFGGTVVISLFAWHLLNAQPKLLIPKFFVILITTIGLLLGILAGKHLYELKEQQYCQNEDPQNIEAGNQIREALRNFKNDHTYFPNTLEELAPHYLSRVPTLVSGEPFEYQLAPSITPLPEGTCRVYGPIRTTMRNGECYYDNFYLIFKTHSTQNRVDGFEGNFETCKRWVKRSGF
jgi:hypothetical protein